MLSGNPLRVIEREWSRLDGDRFVNVQNLLRRLSCVDREADCLCPSQGTMDVFVEPVMPSPLLIVLGASPVAVALAELAPRFDYHVTVCAPPEDQGLFASADSRIEGRQ